MAPEINSVGVVGLGTMGAGIVEVFARAGVRVVGAENTAELAERGRAILEKSTQRAVDRGKLAEADRTALLGRVEFVDRLAGLADVDLVIEAVPEKLDLKRQVFAELDRVVGPQAVLATNTSSLSVTDIAVATTRPERVVGMHFFNPAPVLKLVEVIRTVVADDGVVDAVRDLAVRLGKLPVVVGDQAGFIANALLFGYLNRAISMLQNGFATREDIDTAMTVGGGLPMGPFTLLDLVGLDVALEIGEVMFAHNRDPLSAPQPVLRQLVTAGMAGRKSGRGFYRYEKPGSGTVVPDAASPAEPGSGERATGEQATGEQATGDSSSEPGTVAVVGSGSAAEEVLRALGEAGVEATAVAATADLGDEDLALVADDASIAEVAGRAARPETVVGLHLHPPTKRGRLAEVVRSVASSESAVGAACALARRLGAEPVVCGDRAGRIVDALLYPYLNDAVKMLQVHYATADDVDTAMTAGCGYPVGPIAQLEQIGLDHALEVERSIYAETRQGGLAPAPLLEQLVSLRRGFRTGS